MVAGKVARESLGLGCLFRQSLAKYVDGGRADRRTEVSQFGELFGIKGDFAFSLQNLLAKMPASVLIIGQRPEVFKFDVARGYAERGELFRFSEALF